MAFFFAVPPQDVLVERRFYFRPRPGEHAAQFLQVVLEREKSLTPSPESADVHVAVDLLYLAVLRDRGKALLHLEERGKLA